MTAEERFAKRFGQLQRDLERAIVPFYQDVGELPPGDALADQTAFWMDDQRALMILTICGPSQAVTAVRLPTSWWQHLKQALGLSFEAHVIAFPDKACAAVRNEQDVAFWIRHMETGQ